MFTIDPGDLLVIPARQFCVRIYMASFLVTCLDQCCDHFVGVIRVRGSDLVVDVSSVFLGIFMLFLVSDMLGLMLCVIYRGRLVIDG